MKATHTSHDKTTSSDPKSMSHRLSVGMVPFFIPPVQSHQLHHNNNNYSSSSSDSASGSGSNSGNGNGSGGNSNGFAHDHDDYGQGDKENTNQGMLDPTLMMTPPLSPTDHSFGSIESRFATASHFSLNVQSPQTDMTSSSAFESLSSPPSSTTLSTAGGSAISPRPISFHWEDYRESEDEDEDDNVHNTEDSDHDYFEHGSEYGHDSHRRQQKQKQKNRLSDDKNVTPGTGGARGVRPYYEQFEGHHSVVRGSSSVSSPSSMPSYSSYFTNGEIPEDITYDSYRHGIGLSVSDMSEELAKARTKMNRASRAMKSMEHEMEALHLSIDENKNSISTARTALEENFWKLECLALNLDKDRQDLNKQLQSVGRECGQVVETVTNWEVRIDWLGKQVDNTSEYVSELVLSEQECMSFVKMIIQQNKQYAMPAISRSTERNIKLMAPPKLKEIAAPAAPAAPTAPQPSLRSPTPSLAVPTGATLSSSPFPHSTASPSPSPPPPRLVNIPMSWLLDPILPQKPPEILSASAETVHHDTLDSTFSTSSSGNSSGGKRTPIEPPAEVWRDFSRLTLAFESGQPRTPFTPFHRGIRSKSSSVSSPTSSSGGIGGGINVVVGPSFKTTTTIRRPQIENLSPMPRVMPVNRNSSSSSSGGGGGGGNSPTTTGPATGRLPGMKRRGKYLPVHSWLQLQFNKTMTTKGPLGKSSTKDAVGFKPITIFQTTV
ncbi:hypothetical protein BG004_004965 [Podila humilis]|nr:hypothetical protein BG004_004965 [Podila humilis]